MSDVRVRFAPSPTGYLHIGGARTALFNWLWARQHGGKFVLRIEDTDRARSTEASVQAILDSMTWLGLDWDEGPTVGGPHGPYFQTERVAIYREFAEKLIRLGHAYRDYTSKDEMASLRAQWAAAGNRPDAFRYTSVWRDKHDSPPGDKPYTVRFKAPRSGTTGWVDLVKGRIDVPNDAQQDQVLLREDGIPLYNFGAAVDDLTMGITLVARGDDHVVNTPMQLLIFEALGEKPPELAHLPMILAPSGQKLSKREAAVGVMDYAQQGYLPDAVLNYLARLGWSLNDKDEIFSKRELIEKFSWDRCGSTAGKYDLKKFQYVQATHLRNPDGRADLPTLADIARAAKPFVEKAGIVYGSDARLEEAIGTARTKVTLLAELPEQIAFYFQEEPPLDPAAKAKFLTPERAPMFEHVIALLKAAPTFEAEALKHAVESALPGLGLQMKDLGQPVRVALTGKTQSPGLFEMMQVLGRDATITRLERARASCAQA